MTFWVIQPSHSYCYDETIGSEHGGWGWGMCPPKIFSGGCPLKFQGEENIERKIKKMKEKQRKVEKFSIGSKQMGQKMMSFQGDNPLNPNFFDPVPLKILSFRRHWMRLLLYHWSIF